ncbi:MAG: arginine--tRNA ligase [Thermodesulfobacteriota bacterium]|nr:arginine--tRNA ligase [Thermodesulfobacteriota bacterium]
MRTKEALTIIIKDALSRCIQKGVFNVEDIPDIEMEIPRIQQHGDFSTNIAMIFASKEKKPPQCIAKSICENIEDNYHILAKVEVAGPGFLNFFLTGEYWRNSLKDIEKLNSSYGKSNIGAGKEVQVEFVSANPTGPLHIGHGRGAAVGDTLANIMKAAGYNVVKEYYINDVGNQMETLGKSVSLRYIELYGREIYLPKKCYQGEYIKDIARDIKAKYRDRYLDGSNSETVSFFSFYASDYILKGIRDDLRDFNVEFDEWFSEKALFEKEKISEIISELEDKGFIYQKDGAYWFRTTQFGDEKDRVVIRANGQPTYFASDIAYHKDKLERKFDMIINIWGADHHGYIPRMESVIQAFGEKKEVLEVLLVQLVNLMRDGKPIAMSTRSGEFVTLKEVIREVGKDAARYFFLMRSSDSPLDFDLELAKRQSNENPVYYVQYAHARICSILRLAKERKLEMPKFEQVKIDLLNLSEEMILIKQLLKYPDLIERSALSLEPHRITGYLNELASDFHSYYNKNRVISNDPDLTLSRLFLVKMIRVVLKNALELIGVDAPERM